MKAEAVTMPTPAELLDNAITYWLGEARKWAGLGDKVAERVALDSAKAFELEKTTGSPHCYCHHEPLDENGFCRRAGQA